MFRYLLLGAALNHHEQDELKFGFCRRTTGSISGIALLYVGQRFSSPISCRLCLIDRILTIGAGRPATFTYMSRHIRVLFGCGRKTQGLR